MYLSPNSSKLSFNFSSSSTFSDISSVSSLPSPPGGKKTNAFFSNPWSTEDSKTAQFFSIASIPTIDVTESSPYNTPRPPNLEPTISQVFNFHNVEQHNSPPPIDTPTTSPTAPSLEELPKQGTIISSDSLWPPAQSPDTVLRSHSPAPRPTTPPTTNTAHTPRSPHHHKPHAPNTTLRLVRPLGHGAFSSVWLAEDLSPLPLVLRSRRSLRDLRRKASTRLRSAAGVKPHMKLDKSLSLSLGRADSLKKLRDRVPGVRPIYHHVPAAPPSMAMAEGKLLNPYSSLRLDESSLSRASSVSSTGTASSISSSLSSFSDASTAETMNTASTAEVPDALRPGGTKRKELRVFVGEPESLATKISTSGSLSEGSRASKTPRGGRLVAVKMTVRSGAYLHQNLGGIGQEEKEREMERTRVAFVREVEVLRHISHPSITPLLSFLSMPTHHLLVLPYLPGGDLLSLVNSDAAWERLRESVVKRIWVELVGAVGWMHSVGIVHRDVKLENILLTTSLFTTLTPASHAPAVSDLPEDPLPLIKLTDFGLSRFVDIRTPDEKRQVDGKDHQEGQGPWLTTRCGSEAYAAPELIMAPSSSSFVSSRRGEQVRPAGAYDGRETDSWACGVVLYALVTRKLPFGEGVPTGHAGKIGREGEEQEQEGGGGAVRMTPQQVRSARRAWLMRIAKGDYEWPEPPLPSPHAGGGASVKSSAENGVVAQQPWELDEELMGPRLVESDGAKRVVGKLLVRDPRRRARVGSLWSDDVWTGGNGGGDDDDDEKKDEYEDEEEVKLSIDDEEDGGSTMGDDGHGEDELMNELGDDGVVERLEGMDDLSVEEELRLMEELEDELELDDVASATSECTHPEQPRRPYHKHRHLVQDWVDMLEEGGMVGYHRDGSVSGSEGGTVSRGGSLKSLKGRQQTRGWLVEEDSIDDVARREVV